MQFPHARAAAGALSVALAPIALAAVAVSPAAAADRPAGPPAGANACHKLTDGGQDLSPVTLKINVGNPDSVMLAGDCDGGAISFVDDGLTLATAHPSGFHASKSWDFYDFCGGSNTGGDAVDVTGLFKSGTHQVTLTVDNDCGGRTVTPALYLIVKQHH